MKLSNLKGYREDYNPVVSNLKMFLSLSITASENITCRNKKNNLRNEMSETKT